MTLIAPADSLLYWLAAAALAFAFGTGVLRRWVLGRPGVRRGVIFFAAFIAAALVAGLLPSVMISVLLEYGGDWVTPEVAAWWSGALVAGIAGLVVLARAAVGDPSRGRRRCGGCWYDMSATPGMTCPECGRTVKSEKGLFRTRRRKRGLVVAALFLAASATCGALPWFSGGGWKDRMPDTVLVALLPYLNNNSSLLEELHNRIDTWVLKSDDNPDLPPGPWRRFAARQCLTAMRDTTQVYRVVVALNLAGVLGDDYTVVRDRVLELTEDGSPNIRLWALIVVTLSWMDHEECAAAEAALTDSDPNVRLQAAWTLATSISSGARPAAPPSEELLNVAFQDPVPATRHGAIRVLAYHEHSDRSTKVLVAATTDPLAHIRLAALNAFCQLNPQAPESASARTSALRDTEPQVAHEAGYLVGLHGPHDEATIDLLLTMADSDDSRIRWTAMQWVTGLTQTDGDAGAAILDRALRVRNPVFREHVLQALIMMAEPPASLRPLFLELKDSAQQDPEGASLWKDDLDMLLQQLDWAGATEDDDSGPS